eukprot:scaffold46333_cov67-Phaeocystis_antarctica.AAC.1
MQVKSFKAWAMYLEVDGVCWDEFRVLRNELRVHGGGDDGGGGQCEDTAAVLAARAELLVLRARVLAPIGQALSHRPLVLCCRRRYPVGVFLSVQCRGAKYQYAFVYKQ